ncbi:MAG TPA: DUF1801 domain-containing protein [Sphingomicrobium sp.]|nr:DUF1801 domain-containing protein [Sphingomicrobium sp.]
MSRVPSSLVDAKIRSLGDWRGEALSRIRKLIRDADPDVLEEVKWIKPSNPLGVPTWSHHGIICTGETYKDKVKLTFARGAALEDPSALFNSSLSGGMRRAIDIHEGDAVDDTGLVALVREAVAVNLAAKSR